LKNKFSIWDFFNLSKNIKNKFKEHLHKRICKIFGDSNLQSLLLEIEHHRCVNEIHTKLFATNHIKFKEIWTVFVTNVCDSVIGFHIGFCKIGLFLVCSWNYKSSNFFTVPWLSPDYEDDQWSARPGQMDAKERKS
jgi:hypothetical protein